MKIPSSRTMICAAISVLLCSHLLPAEAEVVLDLKNGSHLECLAASLEGNQIIVKVKYGRMVFDKGLFTIETVDRLNDPSGMSEVFPKQVTLSQPQGSPKPPENLPQKISAQNETQQISPPRQVVGTLANANGATRKTSTEVPNDANLLPRVIEDDPDIPAYIDAAQDGDQERLYQAKWYDIWIPSKVKGNPTVEVEALIPNTNDNETPPSASNLVYFAPYLNYGGSWMTRDLAYGPGSNRTFWDFAEVYGMTVFTIHFHADPQDTENRSACFYFPESGSFDTLFNARDRLINDFKLEKRKMFVMGDSAGSSMAERLGLYYPNDVAAVAMLGGGGFDPVKHHVNVSWCVLNTRGDFRAKQNKAFVASARDAGMDALYAETPTVAVKKEDYDLQEVHHTASVLGLNIMQLFLVDVSQLAETSDGNAVLPYEKWPFMCSSDQPFHILSNIPPDPGKKCADWVFLPSQRFCDLWQQIPYRHASLNSPLSEGEISTDITIRYPEGDSPKGIIICDMEIGGLDDEARDCVDYLASKNYICVLGSLKEGSRNRIVTEKKVSDWVLSQPTWNSYPIFLAGIESGGRDAILGGCNINCPRLKGIGAVDAPLEWPFADLSPIENLPQLACPLRLIEDNNYISSYDPNTFIDYAVKCNKDVTLTSIRADDDFSALDRIIAFFDGSPDSEFGQ